MKKLLIGFLFSFLVLFSSAAQVGTYKTYVVTNAGGTFTTAPANLPDIIYVAVNGVTTLSNNFSINTTTTPAYGTHFRVYFQLSDLDLNGHTVSLFGATLTQEQLLTIGYYDFVVTTWSGSPIILYNYAPADFDITNAIFGGAIQDSTVQLSALAEAIPFSYLDTVGRGRILLGNSTNTLSSYYSAGSGKILIGDGSDLVTKSVTGDITLTSGGVTYIDSATIRDSSIATGAAIKWQKLATGTASYVAVTNSSGYLTTEQYLLPIRGGTGINTNASTGFATVSAGTWSVGTMTDSKTFTVSLDTTSIGDVKVLFPFACTVTGFYAEVTKTVEASNNATITPKNNAGTTMTSGALTITAGTTIGTAFTSTPSANNVFTAGQVMTLSVAKSNAGGAVLMTVTYTRNN